MLRRRAQTPRGIVKGLQRGAPTRAAGVSPSPRLLHAAQGAAAAQLPPHTPRTSTARKRAAQASSPPSSLPPPLPQGRCPTPASRSRSPSGAADRNRLRAAPLKVIVGLSGHAAPPPEPRHGLGLQPEHKRLACRGRRGTAGSERAAAGCFLTRRCVLSHQQAEAGWRRPPWQLRRASRRLQKPASQQAAAPVPKKRLSARQASEQYAPNTALRYPRRMLTVQQPRGASARVPAALAEGCTAVQLRALGTCVAH